MSLLRDPRGGHARGKRRSRFHAVIEWYHEAFPKILNGFLIEDLGQS